MNAGFAHFVYVTVTLFCCTSDIILKWLPMEQQSPGFCPPHTSQNKSIHGGGDQPVLQQSPTPMACAGWVMAGGGGRARASRTSSAEQGTGVTPSWDSQGISPLPSGTRSTIPPQCKAWHDVRFLFMIWYINELSFFLLNNYLDADVIYPFTHRQQCSSN